MKYAICLHPALQARRLTAIREESSSWHLAACLVNKGSSPSCAGMRWSAPELDTNLGTNSDRWQFSDGQLFEMNGGLGRD